jgi:hypothetical protein
MPPPAEPRDGERWRPVTLNNPAARESERKLAIAPIAQPVSFDSTQPFRERADGPGAPGRQTR